MDENDDKAIDEEQTSILEDIINSKNNLSIKVIVPKDIMMKLKTKIKELLLVQVEKVIQVLLKILLARVEKVIQA